MELQVGDVEEPKRHLGGDFILIKEEITTQVTLGMLKNPNVTWVVISSLMRMKHCVVVLKPT